MQVNNVPLLADRRHWHSAGILTLCKLVKRSSTAVDKYIRQSQKVRKIWVSGGDLGKTQKVVVAVKLWNEHNWSRSSGHWNKSQQRWVYCNKKIKKDHCNLSGDPYVGRGGRLVLIMSKCEQCFGEDASGWETAAEPERSSGRFLDRTPALGVNHLVGEQRVTQWVNGQQSDMYIGKLKEGQVKFTGKAWECTLGRVVKCVLNMSVWMPHILWVVRRLQRTKKLPEI